MTGRDHAKLLGLLFWILTAFQLVIVGLIGIFYIFFFGIMFSQMPQGRDDPPPEIILPIIIVVVAFILLTTVAFAIPKIVAGYGLRKEKSWAKVWAIIACCMAVMNVPLGTAVGVYGLVFLFGENGKAYFDDPNYGRLAGSTDTSVVAPAPNSWQ